LACVALCAFGAAHAQQKSAPLTFSASYPEGPLWRGNQLYVAEMGADRVSVFADARRTSFFTQRGCGPTAIAPYGEGFAVNCHVNGSIAIIDARGVFQRRVDRTQDGRRFRNPNDNTAGPDGAVYFSDPGPFLKNSNPVGAIVLLTRDGAAKDVAGPLWYPNGVYFDAHTRALYVSEHMARRIWVYPVKADLSLGPRRMFADLDRIAPYTGQYPEAGPDGLERAANGDLYVALYGEGRVLRLGVDGALKGVIAVETPYVTNVAFAPNGRGIYVGAFDNDAPPFRGRIAPLPAIAR
jgi:sugar lactone lactonase YvrE